MKPRVRGFRLKHTLMSGYNPSVLKRPTSRCFVFLCQHLPSLVVFPFASSFFRARLLPLFRCLPPFPCQCCRLCAFIDFNFFPLPCLISLGCDPFSPPPPSPLHYYFLLPFFFIFHVRKSSVCFAYSVSLHRLELNFFSVRFFFNDAFLSW